jgi:hypothetical protein
VDQLLNWISAAYSPKAVFWAWGAIVLSLVIIHCFELVFPAQRGQNYRAIGFNSAAAFAYLTLTPIANFLPGYVVTSAVQAAHGPWFTINLPGIIADQSGWVAGYVANSFRFRAVVHFRFLLLLVSPLAAHEPVGMGATQAASHR